MHGCELVKLILAAWDRIVAICHAIIYAIFNWIEVKVLECLPMPSCFVRWTKTAGTKLWTTLCLAVANTTKYPSKHLKSIALPNLGPHNRHNYVVPILFPLFFVWGSVVNCALRCKLDIWLGHYLDRIWTRSAVLMLLISPHRLKGKYDLERGF